MNLVGFAIVFACLLAGYAIIGITGLPLPPSIIGLLILFGLLSIKKGRFAKTCAKIGEKTGQVAKTMLDYLAFMVVPASVAIAQYLDLLKQDARPLLLATVLSTLLVLFIVAFVHRSVRRWVKRRADKAGDEH